MKYMICGHTIGVLDRVLVTYPAGDADRGIVINSYGDENEVSVLVGNKLKPFVSESVSHFDCDVEDVLPDEMPADYIDNMDAAFDNTIVGQCKVRGAACNSDVNANGDHINLQHDPLHVFDAIHRFTYEKGNFVIWMGGMTAKVGHQGVKRHYSHVNVWVTDGVAHISNGNVFCGANKGYNKHHDIRRSEEAPVNCERCIGRPAASHVLGSTLVDKYLRFHPEFNKYPAKKVNA